MCIMLTVCINIYLCMYSMYIVRGMHVNRIIVSVHLHLSNFIYLINSFNMRDLTCTTVFVFTVLITLIEWLDFYCTTL